MPAFLNIVDIAGLVKGAAEGQGLGNAFLSHIGACDAIFHLCRAFDDPDVIHVEGEVNPVRDFDIISEELRLKDEETLLKNLEKLERVCIRGTDKKLKPEYVSAPTHCGRSGAGEVEREPWVITIPRLVTVIADICMRTTNR